MYLLLVCIVIIILYVYLCLLYSYTCNCIHIAYFGISKSHNNSDFWLPGDLYGVLIGTGGDGRSPDFYGSGRGAARLRDYKAAMTLSTHHESCMVRWSLKLSKLAFLSEGISKRKWPCLRIAWLKEICEG